jgi:CRP/FNR family transcriptional regulator
MLLLGRKTAREKVASLISIFGRRATGLGMGRPGGGWVLQLPMTREQMADYLGITLETVSRQISALKRDEIIELPEARTLVVPDPGRLLAESGDT